MENLDLTAVETSDKVRLTGSYMQLRANGDSYLSQTAARMLGFNHGDVIRFYHNADLSRWFVSNDPIQGATIKKNGGLYKFCDTNTVKMIFNSMNLKVTRANFMFFKDLVKQNDLVFLEVNPKPHNIK